MQTQLVGGGPHAKSRGGARQRVSGIVGKTMRRAKLRAKSGA